MLASLFYQELPFILWLLHYMFHDHRVTVASPFLETTISWLYGRPKALYKALNALSYAATDWAGNKLRDTPPAFYNRTWSSRYLYIQLNMIELLGILKLSRSQRSKISWKACGGCVTISITCTFLARQPNATRYFKAGTFALRPLISFFDRQEKSCMFCRSGHTILPSWMAGGVEALRTIVAFL